MIIDGRSGNTVDKIISVSVPGRPGPAGFTPPASTMVRPVRSTIAAVGDSMTARNSLGQQNVAGPNGGNMGSPVGVAQSYLNPTYLHILPIISHQRIREAGGMYAESNSWVTWQESIQLPFVLAMDPLPGACVLACGNAEILGNTAYSFSANQGLIKSMVAQLLAVGVAPILWTIPPITSTVQVVDAATINARLTQWNVWIRRYAAENGFAMIDAHTALAQVDGTHIPGTVVSDLLHPNGPGHMLIAKQALADGLADIFPPNSLVNTARTTNDLTSLFNDGTVNLGLFTTYSAGVGTGLSAAGTATFSVVAPTGPDELAGNWQQITVAAGNSASVHRPITSGWSVGDTIALICRVQTENMTISNSEYTVALVTNDATTYNGMALWGGYATLGPDIEDGELYIEFEISAGTTTLAFYSWIQLVTSGSATLRVGEVTIRNLTTGGFLV